MSLFSSIPTIVLYGKNSALHCSPPENEEAQDKFAMYKKALEKILSELISSKTILRNQDFASRYGGEEFLLVLPHTYAHNTYHVAERLSHTFRTINFTESEEHPCHITISIGITESIATDTEIQDLIKLADKALYYAKENGRNRIIIYRDVCDADGTPFS